MIHASLSTPDCNDAYKLRECYVDVYFSADIETDGPIPGPYSMLSVDLVFAGRHDGTRFIAPKDYSVSIYREFKPISEQFQEEALAVNGLDREGLKVSGAHPRKAMAEIAAWNQDVAAGGKPVLVAYPLSFDWTWLYWYFMNYLDDSPFGHSRCFDMKTAIAFKHGLPISQAGRSRLPPQYRTQRRHTHHALDDAIAQAEIFAKVFADDDAAQPDPATVTALAT